MKLNEFTDDELQKELDGRRQKDKKSREKKEKLISGEWK